MHEFYGKNWEGEYGKKVKKLFKPLSIIRKSMIPNKEWDDEVSAKILENHMPHGVSTKTLTHLGKMMKDGSENGLSLFDWNDPVLNKELYGSEQVPTIDFTKNPVPMVIFAGVHDKIVNIEDVR